MADIQRPSKESLAEWPQAVFADSNSLYSLGPQFEHVDFAKLLEAREYLGFDLLVPEVCWLEFLRQRRIEIDDCLQKNRKNTSLLRRLGLETKQLDDSAKLLGTFTEHLDEHFLNKATAAGIKVLPLPTIELNRLLKMAVDRVSPFQESGEKGFRDSLILFTCLEAIRGRPDLNALAITDDHKLGEALKQFAEEYETQIDVATNFAEALKLMLARADQWYRDKLRIEAAEAKRLLLKYRAEIERKIGEVTEFSRFELMGFSTADIGNVERVLSMGFKDVGSAIWKERTANGGRVLFSLKAELTLQTSEPSYNFFDTKFKIGGEKYTPTFSPPILKEKIVEKSLYGEASFVKVGNELELTELRIDKFLPTEDLVRLIRTNGADSED